MASVFLNRVLPLPIIFLKIVVDVKDRIVKKATVRLTKEIIIITDEEFVHMRDCHVFVFSVWTTWMEDF